MAASDVEILSYRHVCSVSEGILVQVSTLHKRKLIQAAKLELHPSNFAARLVMLVSPQYFGQINVSVLRFKR